ncbi:hypothetical protein B0H13DRAFT_1888308 [Mycena leptocephala]|nr:hypothetical protein B0H13DRAFT_1888308 [Mycena leptocephala]
MGQSVRGDGGWSCRGPKSDEDPSADDFSDAEEPVTMPTRRRSKRFSTTNLSDDDEPERKKRRKSSPGKEFDLPAIFTDAVAQDIMGSDYIDLTAADEAPSGHSTPEFLRMGEHLRPSPMQ